MPGAVAPTRTPLCKPLLIADLLDGYEKIVSAFVIETCKTRMTASALSSCAINVYNLLY